VVDPERISVCVCVYESAYVCVCVYIHIYIYGNSSICSTFDCFLKL